MYAYILCNLSYNYFMRVGDRKGLGFMREFGVRHEKYENNSTIKLSLYCT